MRQRQSRQLRLRAKKARERRAAAFLRYRDKQNANKPRRSLRLALKKDGDLPRVILFGEEGFFSDDEAALGPPLNADYRIKYRYNFDDESISTADNSGTSTSFNEDSTSDITAPSVESSRFGDNESTTTRVREIRARWTYPFSIGCPASDSDLGSGST